MEADDVPSADKQASAAGMPAADLAGDAEAADYADGQAAGDAADTAAEDATGAQARCLRRTCVNFQAARPPVSSQISA